MRKLLLVLVLVSQGAFAAFQTGNRLLSDCKSDANSVGLPYCYGYLAAANDTHLAWVSSNRIEKHFCLAKGVTVEQLRLVVVKHLEAHPDKLHLAAAGLTLNALIEAFPCD